MLASEILAFLGKLTTEAISKLTLDDLKAIGAEALRIVKDVGQAVKDKGDMLKVETEAADLAVDVAEELKFGDK